FCPSSGGGRSIAAAARGEKSSVATAATAERAGKAGAIAERCAVSGAFAKSAGAGPRFSELQQSGMPQQSRISLEAGRESSSSVQQRERSAALVRTSAEKARESRAILRIIAAILQPGCPPP